MPERVAKGFRTYFDKKLSLECDVAQVNSWGFFEVVKVSSLDSDDMQVGVRDQDVFIHHQPELEW